MVRDLYAIGLNRAEVLELLRLVDWFLNLPQELDADFWTQVDSLDDKLVPYVMSIERIARQRVLQDIVIESLTLNHGDLPGQLTEQIRAIKDEARRKPLTRAAITAETPWSSSSAAWKPEHPASPA